MDTAEVYKQADEALLEDMDGELLLYYPPTAITLHLNGPSAIVWQLCDGERSCAEIISLVKEAFPDQAAQIKTDVLEVIQDLSKRNVLQRVA